MAKSSIFSYITKTEVNQLYILTEYNPKKLGKYLKLKPQAILKNLKRLGIKKDRKEAAIARFYNNLKLSKSGCLEWEGSLQTCGYGQFIYQGHNWTTHRLAWILSGRYIPKDMQLNHTCNNTKCVNINHLYIGTQLDNIDDRDQHMGWGKYQ
jgi:hypothetical protein